MFNQTIVFTFVPFVGVIVYGWAYFQGITWLGVLALLACLPALFYRFVNGDFLFLLFAIVLIVISSLIFKKPVTGLISGLVIWVLIFVIFDLYNLATIKRSSETLSAEQKVQMSEQIKLTYQYDTSALRTKKTKFNFRPVISPVTEHVTKFGGQPVWLDSPQWPLSRDSGKPMKFIGQVSLSSEILGKKKAKMAYLFYSDELGKEVETYDMDGGENAVILQPGNPNISVVAQETGDTIECNNKKNSCEFIVDLVVEDDSPFIPRHVYLKMDKKSLKIYDETIRGNKIGGTPYFLQDDEFPQHGAWQLLLQLHNEPLPFDVNIGLGVGYVFINSQGTEAKFFWQQ